MSEITISYNDNIEKYSIKSFDEKYTNRRNFEIKVSEFLKRKRYHITLSNSYSINSNFRFFNLSDRLALQIGNYRITRDGGLDIIGDKNGMQIIVQVKFSRTGKYPNLKKAYKEFINTVETRKSTKEIGIFVVTNNINIQKLKNITSTEQEEHMTEMLKLYNDISNAVDCINNQNLSMEDLKIQLAILKSQLENINDIKNIMSCNIKKYGNIKNLNLALELSKFSSY
ncbi:17717_t:CDS:2 [Dentiscutata erythropus]|uniref:17717_t:CDS:1 n=1 Tax=Dentiscutata erythropus TaxID=1348616 RepID=A0A9N8Z6T8_9GLOM|nr:17717_t:CDS:2 [Dentiscutata erythropus]